MHTTPGEELRRVIQDTALYVVTRRDLPTGKAVAQIVHAAMLLQDTARYFDGADLPQTVIILSVEDQGALLDLNEQLDRENLFVEIFVEPDLDHEFTALAAVASTLHPMLGDLPLFAPGSISEPSEREQEQ